MRNGKTVKAARVAARVEPDLLCAIEREAQRRQKRVGHTIRTMLRDQLAILMLANSPWCCPAFDASGPPPQRP